MTLFEINILAHYAVSAVDHPLMAEPPPIWRDTMSKFVADGLLSCPQFCSAVAYVKTDRLVAYVEALQLVPLPVQRWVMP